MTFAGMTQTPDYLLYLESRSQTSYGLYSLLTDNPSNPYDSDTFVRLERHECCNCMNIFYNEAVETAMHFTTWWRIDLMKS